MTILTTAQLQEHIETDLGDNALQRLADAAEQMIDRADGGTADVTETYDAWGFPMGRDTVIFTSRAISTITTIKERDFPDDDQITLAADDYQQHGQRQLVRLQDGTNPRLLWAAHVEVVYTPAVDDVLRQMVQVDLVKFLAAYSGAQRERIGDFDFWHADSDVEIRAILGRLKTGRTTLGLR